MNLELTEKLPFIVLEGTMQATGEKRYQWSYPVWEPTCHNTNLLGKICPLIQKWH